MLSDLVVCYLFLGGTGAGGSLVLSVLGLLVPVHACQRFRACIFVRTPRTASCSAPGFVAAFVLRWASASCLLADLGNAERVILLLLHPTASYLAVGSWALAACLALAAALGLAWLGVGVWNVALVRILQVATALVAVVMVYTGLLLQSLGAVPLWATPWLPALFAASSLSCGIACLLALAQLTGVASAFDVVLGRLAAVDAVVIVIEAIVVAVFVYAASLAGAPLSNGTELAAAQSVRELVAGANAQLFWGGFVALRPGGAVRAGRRARQAPPPAAGRRPVHGGVRAGRRVRHAVLRCCGWCPPGAQLDGSDVICFRSKWIRPPTCRCGCSCVSGSST